MEAAQPSVPTYDLKMIVESLSSMGFKITVKELKSINVIICLSLCFIYEMKHYFILIKCIVDRYVDHNF